MPSIVFFEVPANDIDRAKGFYSDIFDWRISGMPEKDYCEIDTNDSIGITCGGMLKRAHPGQRIINYIAVSSVDEYSARVLELGGKVVLQKRAVPKAGYFAVCQDTEGNAFILWEKDDMAR